MTGSRPETRFAHLGEDRIAYQVVGDGPIDLLFMTGAFSSIDALWDHPDSAEVVKSFARFSRLIAFDPRGTGASDPLPDNEPFGWETWVEDLKCVLDSIGLERAAILTVAESGSVAMLFAATEPQRTSALVLVTPTARYTQAPDYPIGFPSSEASTRAAFLREIWGTEAAGLRFYPSRTSDKRFLEWFARFQRMAANSRTIEAYYSRAFELDARHVLPLIHVPTLVIATSNVILPADHAHYIADRIDGARLEVFETKDFAPIFEQLDETADMVQEFLTGARRVGEPNRRLATVLFTDIVGSTDRASALGDARWRRLLDEHDEVVRDAVTRLGGKLVKTTGDGALATFDGPAKGIRATMALRETLRAIDIDIRAGLHAGEVEMRGDDVGGIAVHIAARVMAEAAPGEILASSTVKDLVVGSGMAFSDRGTRVLKGIPDEWRLYAVESV